MAIEKGMYSAPEGMDEIAEADGPSLEIEIIEPEAVILDDGSMEITLIPDAEMTDMMSFDINLAEVLDESHLQEISGELTGLIESDIDGRKEWADTFVKGLDVLGFKYEERTDPWEGACGVYSTVLAEAAIRFQAETMSETFPAAGPVKVKILGEETKDKEEAAQRVKADMNYELTERMVEYRPEHERLLYSLGLSGSAFKKVYYDPNMGRQAAIYIPAEDVIVPYGASHIETAERVTHVMRKTKNELRKLQAAGFYRDIELGDPQPYHSDIEERKAEEGGFSLTDDNRYALYEVHVDMIIDGVVDICRAPAGALQISGGTPRRERRLYGSWWTLVRCLTCRADLSLVGYELRATIRRLSRGNGKTWTCPVGLSATTSCHFPTKSQARLYSRS